MKTVTRHFFMTRLGGAERGSPAPCLHIAKPGSGDNTPEIIPSTGTVIMPAWLRPRSEGYEFLGRDLRGGSVDVGAAGW